MSGHTTDEELRTAARHVGYELAMMRVAGRVVPHLKLTLPREYAPHGNEIAGLIRNLLIEGTLVHVRAILEFLYPRKSARPDDILARDYSPAWDDDPTGKTAADEAIEALRKRLDKHLAHLTLERVRSPEPIWPNRMFDDVREHFRRFRETLPPERQAWFDEGYLD